MCHTYNGYTGTVECKPFSGHKKQARDSLYDDCESKETEETFATTYEPYISTLESIGQFSERGI